MYLSKKARRGITAFNKARNPLYSGKYLDFPQADLKTQQYIDAFLSIKGAQNDSNADKSREVAGKPIPEGSSSNSI